MFTSIDSIINAYKTTNTQIAESLFTNKKVSAPMVALIDAQATFAKQVNESFTKIADYVVEEVQSYTNKPSKK